MFKIPKGSSHSNCREIYCTFKITKRAIPYLHCWKGHSYIHFREDYFISKCWEGHVMFNCQAGYFIFHLSRGLFNIQIAKKTIAYSSRREGHSIFKFPLRPFYIQVVERVIVYSSFWEHYYILIAKKAITFVIALRAITFKLMQRVPLHSYRCQESHHFRLISMRSITQVAERAIIFSSSRGPSFLSYC